MDPLTTEEVKDHIDPVSENELGYKVSTLKESSDFEIVRSDASYNSDNRMVSGEFVVSKTANSTHERNHLIYRLDLVASYKNQKGDNILLSRTTCNPRSKSSKLSNRFYVPEDCRDRTIHFRFSGIVTKNGAIKDEDLRIKGGKGSVSIPNFRTSVELLPDVVSFNIHTDYYNPNSNRTHSYNDLPAARLHNGSNMAIAGFKVEMMDSLLIGKLRVQGRWGNSFTGTNSQKDEVFFGKAGSDERITHFYLMLADSYWNHYKIEYKAEFSDGVSYPIGDRWQKWENSGDQKYIGPGVVNQKKYLTKLWVKVLKK